MSPLIPNSLKRAQKRLHSGFPLPRDFMSWHMFWKIAQPRVALRVAGPAKPDPDAPQIEPSGRWVHKRSTTGRCSLTPSSSRDFLALNTLCLIFVHVIDYVGYFGLMANKQSTGRFPHAIGPWCRPVISPGTLRSTEYEHGNQTWVVRRQAAFDWFRPQTRVGKGRWWSVLFPFTYTAWRLATFPELLNEE